ncbi:reverse transcriptase [Elysia marginata]|uniref:Reverse transcriptase n=1 Tax=Elysia marginata TaxID=1093978 RepID=A0AAV4I3M8_9GAST|nr:reverse transcriptase [Elysia marginata]
MEKVRDRSGKLTDWITGRRIIWIEVPATALPTYTPIGPFKAMLYYREQKQLTCRRCLGNGHKTENCKNEEVCLTCKKPGHRKADGKCEGILDGKLTQNGPSDKMGDGPLEDRTKFFEENGTEEEREDGEVGSEVKEEEVERIDGVDTSEGEMENVLEKRQSDVKAVDYLRRGPSIINTEEEREEGEVASEVEEE